MATSIISDADLQIIMSVNAEYEKSIKLAQEEKDIRQQVIKTIEAENKFQQDRQTALLQITEYQKAINDLKTAELNLENQRAVKNGVGIQNAKEQIKAQNEIIRAIEKQIEKAEEFGKKLQASLKKGEEAADSFFGRKKGLIEELAEKSAEEAEAFVKGFRKKALELETIYAGLNKLISGAGDAFMKGFNIPFLGVQIQGVGEILKDVLTAPSEAFTSFGNLDKYAGSIQRLTQGSEKFRVTNKELYAAVGELNQGFAGFADLNTNLQTKLADTVTKLTAAGFSAKSQVASFNLLTRVFGETAESAEKTVIKIAALGKTLGTGGKALEDFVALGPKLALFGKETAEKVFEETAIAAKKLGVEVQTLYNIVGNYDSFEKAAEAAGNFNLFLGGQFLDPLKLMKASIEEGPVPTLKLLKEAFDASGRDLDKLGPAFIRFGAEATKLDPQMFKNLFKGGSGELDKYIAQQEEATKRQNDLNKITEKTQNIFKQIQNAFAAAFADPKMIASLVKVADTIMKMSMTVAKMIGFLVEHKNLFITVFAIGQLMNALNAIKAIATATRIAFGWEAATKVLKYGPIGAALVVAAGAAGAAYLTSSDDTMPGYAGANMGAATTAIEQTSKLQGSSAPKTETPKIPSDDVELSGKMTIGDKITSGADVVAINNGSGPISQHLIKQTDLLREIKEHMIQAAKTTPTIMVDKKVLGQVVSAEQSHSTRYDPTGGKPLGA